MSSLEGLRDRKPQGEERPLPLCFGRPVAPPLTSRVRVTHVGRPYDDVFAEEAQRHTASNPRYRWLGEVLRWKARRLLSRSRLLAQISIMEGGANVVSEALAPEVPVIGSDIPGNVGMLGEEYPGYYGVGDEVALARLLHRAETDGAFTKPLRPGAMPAATWCCPSASGWR